MRNILKMMELHFLIIFSICGMASPASAQESDFKKEINELKQGQQALNKELQELKLLLLQRMPATSVPQVNVRGVEFELGKSPVTGSNKARLVLVEFTDYQCQFCSRHARETHPQIMEHYVLNNKLAYSIINQPLSSHQKAFKAAEAFHCAGEQNKYWEMHILMMSKPELIDNLTSYANALNLDIIRFDNCLRTNKYADFVRNEKELASKLGVKGVPGFILASRDPLNPLLLKGITFIPGAQPYNNFQKEIDRALESVDTRGLFKQ